MILTIHVSSYFKISVWLVCLLCKATKGQELKCNEPSDLVFLLDGSDSINDEDWSRGKNFIKRLIDSLPIGRDAIRVGMVVYSSNVGDVVGLKQFRTKEELKVLANGLRHPKDGTDTATGIRRVTQMMEMEARSHAVRVAIVITDGRSRHPSRTIREAMAAKKVGIMMITVGVGQAIFSEELSKIASSNQKMFNVADFSGLQDIVKTLKKLICRIITTTTSTTSTTTPVVPITKIRTMVRPTNPTKVMAKLAHRSPQVLCKGCIIDRGIGYNPDPDDCSKYVQCYLQNGEYHTQIMPCPFGTFWDQSTITCIRSSLVNCPVDPCFVQRNDFTFAMDTNCAGYWSCYKGRSEAQCCPSNYTYVQNKGCVSDLGCRKPCPSAIVPVKEQNIIECNLRPDKDNPNLYIQLIPGFGPVSRPCAPGSTFKRNICSCARKTDSKIYQKECTPSAYYNFNKDLLDHSGHKVSAGFLRVWLTKNGTAKFTEQSRINIWRFAGVDYGTKLYIAFRFLKYSQGPKNQVLITNCNGHRGQGPSVSVFSVGDKLVMTIKTQSSSTGRLAFTMKTGFQDVIMRYDGHHLTGIVNGVAQSTKLSGRIDRRQAGLLIGDCDSSSFHGEIDYFAIYTCLPDMKGKY